MSNPLRIGVVGCGNISDIYLRNAPRFPSLSYVAVCDLNPAAAAAKSAVYGIPHCTPAEMMARDDVDAILNLTVPAVHAEVSLQAIAAGKHVYSEKPLATSVEDGARVLAAADARGVRVGVAPDTFLGAGIQKALELIQGGATGRITGGIATFLSPGMEDWHPNPGFFFRDGAGPAMDMGPYYITALLNLLGPVRRLQATGAIAKPERIVTAEGPMTGQAVKVETFTTLNALLSFESGAEIVLMTSWDVPLHTLPHIELYGTEGTIRVPDPDSFGGQVELSTKAGTWEASSVDEAPLGIPNDDSIWGFFANYRGVGLAEMAVAIQEGRPHRASGAMGLHALAIMRGIVESARSGKAVTIDQPFLMPAPLSGSEARSLLGNRI